MKKQGIITAALTAALLAGAGWAQATEGIVLRALDEPVALKLLDGPLPEALTAISEASGVRIELPDDVLALLPHGGETRVRIEGTAVLGEALTSVLTPMSLTWRAVGGGVHVEASEELRRINRRATFTEVTTLAKLAKGRLAKGMPVLQQLREITGVEELRFLWHIRGEGEGQAQAVARADLHLPCTGAEYLRWLCHGRGRTWYLWGSDLVIVTEQAQALRQLNRQVSVRYDSRNLMDVMADLAHKAGLKLAVDPGVLERVNPDTQNRFSLRMSDVTVGEALEVISGATGLMFEPDRRRLRVRASAALPTTRPVRRRRFPFIVTTEVVGKDGTSYRVFFFPEDLPADLVDAIEKKREELLEKIEKTYGQGKSD